MSSDITSAVMTLTMVRKVRYWNTEKPLTNPASHSVSSRSIDQPSTGPASPSRARASSRSLKG